MIIASDWFGPIFLFCQNQFYDLIINSEMETGRVDWHRSGRPAGRVAGGVKILRPAGQAG